MAIDIAYLSGGSLKWDVGRVVERYPMTISQWFRMPSSPLSPPFNFFSAAYRNSGSNNTFYLLFRDSLTAQCYVRRFANAVADSGSGAFATNEWIHFVGVSRDGADTRLYMNGNEVGSSTTDNTGWQALTTQYLTTQGGEAQHAEIALWSEALDNREIVRLASGVPASEVRRSRLRAYAPLRDHFGEVINKLDATVAGTVTFAEGPPLRHVRKRWYFDFGPTAGGSIIPQVMHHRRVMGVS